MPGRRGRWFPVRIFIYSKRAEKQKEKYSVKIGKYAGRMAFFMGI